jgi:hypothetical protein
MTNTHRAPLDSTIGDPVLAELVNGVTERLLAGEDVDVARLAAAPEHAARIRSLLPALQALAELSAARSPHASSDTDTPPPGDVASDCTPSALGASPGDDHCARQLQGFLDAPQQADEIGRLADYRVLSVLGAGGAGIVLRAEDEALRRALESLQGLFSDDSDQAQP